MDINYSIKLFKEVESNTAALLKQVEQAKAISGFLRELGEVAEMTITRIECELAVEQAQNIIDN